MTQSPPTLEVGDIVKLLKPYRPEDEVKLRPSDWIGYEFGICVEILSCGFAINQIQFNYPRSPRTVSLHLYDRSGQLFMMPNHADRSVALPVYVDFHISELQLLRKSTMGGYETIVDPPDWSKFALAEKVVLAQFMTGKNTVTEEDLS